MTSLSRRKWAAGIRFSLEDFWVGVRVERSPFDVGPHRWWKVYLHFLPCVGLWLAVAHTPIVDPLS